MNIFCLNASIFSLFVRTLRNYVLLSAKKQRGVESILKIAIQTRKIGITNLNPRLIMPIF